MIPAATEGWGKPSFATGDSLTLMWDYVRYFIIQYMPFIMIVVAFFIAWGVAALILQIFTKRDKRDRDDEDFIEYL